MFIKSIYLYKRNTYINYISNEENGLNYIKKKNAYFEQEKETCILKKLYKSLEIIHEKLFVSPSPPSLFEAPPSLRTHLLSSLKKKKRNTQLDFRYASSV